MSTARPKMGKAIKEPSAMKWMNASKVYFREFFCFHFIRKTPLSTYFSCFFMLFTKTKFNKKDRKAKSSNLLARVLPKPVKKKTPSKSLWLKKYMYINVQSFKGRSEIGKNRT